MISMEYKVGMYDSDKNRMAKPSGLIQKMQAAGDIQMATEKPSYDEVFNRGMAFMLSRLDMNILTEIHLDDMITAKSWPCESKRATLLRCYGLWRGEEQVAEVSSKWSLVDIADRKILPIDMVDCSGYTYGPYKEAAPGKFKVPREIEDMMQQVNTHRISYSDADCNGHMNNTYYFDVLCDEIPELEAGTHRVSTIRIYYSNEAVLGDTISICRSEKLEPREGSDQECRYMFKTFCSDGSLNTEAEIGIVKVKKL